MVNVYQTEIKSMLYSFGDVREPNESTTKYLEKILKSHIKAFIQEAKKISFYKQTKHLSLEDFCFILRHDFIKLKRISNFLKFKSLKKYSIERQTDVEELDGIISDKEEIFYEDNILDYDWLSSNYKDIEDKEMKYRMEKIDELTQNMSKEEYMIYSEKKQTSFTFKKGKKFRKFINMGRIKENLVELLGYLCYDALYSVVIKALAIRKGNKEKKRSILKNIQIIGLEKKEVEEACRLILLEKGRII